MRDQVSSAPIIAHFPLRRISMRRETLNSMLARAARPRRLAATLLALSFGLAACVYRMPIQQGNYLDGHTVNQLKVGMTRSQVRYLLGTPMVEDIFNKDRWDYVYYFKRGHVRRPIESRVIVYFNGDKVQRLALYNVPKGRPTAPGRLPSPNKFPVT
jgi:outer membrane protein assembly factor BamE